MTRLVQLQSGSVRRVGLVEEPRVRLLDDVASVYELATIALRSGGSLGAAARSAAGADTLEYDPIYDGRGQWSLLCPIDHPDDPARCLVSGTGLTHLGSARNRQVMHRLPDPEPDAELTDSMKMFRLGVEGGRPPPGQIGAAPEWFYKGVGTILRAPGQPLLVPSYAEDGGEEGEIAGIYLIDFDGRPCRLGMAIANEFSDHEFEKRNYLNLAGSKLRSCAIGPELVVDPDFRTVPGQVTIERSGGIVWTKAIATGEDQMSHSLANIEHHHFKFEAHRRPGDVHVHYYGAACLSFGEGVKLVDGDAMVIGFERFGRALRNPLRVAPPSDDLVTVRLLQ